VPRVVAVMFGIAVVAVMFGIAVTRGANCR
jgi:hypothetical protein